MDLRKLLDLQAADVLLDQARHALDHLIERDSYARRRDDLGHIRSRRDDLRREQQTQESQLASIEAETSHIDAQKQRLEAQLRTVIAPREAEALQHEIRTLDLRRGELDDRGLELLESMAAADSALRDLVSDESRAVEAEDSARLELERAVSVMEGEIERLGTQRGEIAAQVPPEDLREYERRRSAFGGVAIAEIHKGVCGGCHMDISISELDAIKRLPPESVAECPNCSRLVVR